MGEQRIQGTKEVIECDYYRSHNNPLTFSNRSKEKPSPRLDGTWRF